MLTTHQEIKAYVIKTIRLGNKKRIVVVLKRYQEWLKEQKNTAADQVFEEAKKLFE